MKRCAVVYLALLLAACQGDPFRGAVSPEFQRPAPIEPREHRLRVNIDSAARTLTVEDQITLHANGAVPSSLAFYLAPELRVEAATINERAVVVEQRPPRLPPGPFDRRRHARFAELARYEVALPPDSAQPLTLAVRVTGPWPMDAHGILLAGESGWYPTWPDALFTFTLDVEHPRDWESVSGGARTTRDATDNRARTIWSTTQSIDAIDLIAGPYIVTTRNTDIAPISTYFFKDDAQLAPEYLDAAAGYLARYSRLLGPYPFTQLAIVETQAPIGAAAASITLLGQSLVRRHYTQPYALGHEIVHAWIGNSVMVDQAQGNWAEALTTYLANYHTIEETDGAAAARREREQMLIQYATWAPPSADYPLMHFFQNESQTDAAIGYQKGAMVFHQLRRMMGDDNFFGALRTLTGEYRGKRASWNDLRLLFEARTGRPLDWFFRQWVVQSGAPQLAIDRVDFSPLPAELEAPGASLMTIHLAQSTPPARLPIMVQIETADRILEKSLWMSEAQAAIETAVTTPPMQITVDPNAHLLRRLSREELPPMLNLSLTEPSLEIVPPDHADPPAAEVYRAIAAQAAERAIGKPNGHAAARFLLGGPEENRATAELAARLPPGIKIGPRAFTVNGRAYSDAGHALLLTLREPSRGDQPTSLFYGLSADAIRPLTSTLLYHGWDSYIVFEQGRAIERGRLPPLRTPLVWTPPSQPGTPP